MNERKLLLSTHLAAIDNELRIYAWFLTDPRNEFGDRWLAGEILALSAEFGQYRMRSLYSGRARVLVPKSLLNYSAELRTKVLGVLHCCGDVK
jgi:hypothetical protein